MVLCLFSKKNEELLAIRENPKRAKRMNGEKRKNHRFLKMSADAQIDEAFELFDREAKGTLTYNNAKTVRFSFPFFQIFTFSNIHLNDSLPFTGDPSAREIRRISLRRGSSKCIG